MSTGDRTGHKDQISSLGLTTQASSRLWSIVQIRRTLFLSANPPRLPGISTNMTAQLTDLPSRASFQCDYSKRKSTKE